MPGQYGTAQLLINALAERFTLLRLQAGIGNQIRLLLRYRTTLQNFTCLGERFDV
jgi:hypothetical protein